MLTVFGYMQDCMIGIVFANEDEAKNFHKRVTEKKSTKGVFGRLGISICNDRYYQTYSGEEEIYVS